jgi:uncharacterized protein YcbX
MESATISALFRYPIKSARGIELERSPVTKTGLSGDRQWLIVDSTGNFVTQRQKAELATLVVHETDGGLSVTCGGQRLTLERARVIQENIAREVTIWNDRVTAYDAGDEAAAFLAATVGQNRGRPMRIVLIKELRVRLIRNADDPSLNGQTSPIAFSDGYPFLITTEASLAHLKGRIEQDHPTEGEPISTWRFRPNIVLAGLPAYAEDRIYGFETAAGVRVQLVKPCTRCVVTMIDQETGARGPEPLRTLRTYRSQPNGIMFGQNGILASGEGAVISVGDEVRVSYR